MDSSIANSIDIGTGKEDNVIVVESTDAVNTPSKRQILLPEFKKYVHVAADAKHFRWIGASNRMFPWTGKNDLTSIFAPKNPTPPRIPDPNRRALTMMFKLTNGNYLTLLPLSGEASVSWLEVTEDGELILDYGSLGTESIPENTNIPLLAWYESENVYESIAKTWELAINDDKVKAEGSLRSIKKYPEALKYLGWCTWEQYRKDINEEILVSAIDKIEGSGVPVRWFLIDDGHQDDESGFLKSFTPNKEKFPNGWQPIISRKKEDAVKWMGIWHGFLSHWNGVHIDHSMQELVPFLVPNPDRKKGLLPKDDMASSEAFYEYLVTTIKGQGFDFMKTDNVSRSTLEYTALANASKAQRQNVLALERACHEHGIGLMNCSAQNTIGMLNASNSATMRTSPDYQKHNLPTSKSQILQSIFNVLWLGQTLWPDHDMFHSSDQEVRESMSVTKAMSGGPIYVSDDPADFNKEVIMPLCYEDGLLVRPEAPAVPLPESIFNDALYEFGNVYRTIAPLKNKACAITAYNLSIKATQPLRGSIQKEDYTYASAMIQPYTGPWEMPKEGLVIYDWKEQTGKKLNGQGLEFQIDGFGHKLFLLCPIKNQWAVIGRPDKYLSPSTVEILDTSANAITLRMEEKGPILLYSATGTPSSDYLVFSAMGNDFYKGVPLKRYPNDNKLKISR
ncbi:Sip1-related alpha-galactosidase [Ulvibacterium sp.]|uniref:Sip1-related alpha-galactosidase n=1 Tax=Ulvibacterium sp. TaxID=2665914 RepID=UPI003BAD66A8